MVNWDEADLAAYYRKHPEFAPQGQLVQDLPDPQLATPSAAPSVAKPTTNKFAPYRSGTEVRFADHLESLRATGEVHRWRYEGITLKVGRRRYTADFVLIYDTYRRPTLIEVKGFWREDAAVKFDWVVAEWGQVFEFVVATWDRSTRSWIMRKVS